VAIKQHQCHDYGILFRNAFEEASSSLRLAPQSI